MTNLSYYIGDIIREARTKQRITQTELGKMLNLQRSSIAKYEAGTQRMFVDTLVEISNILEIDFSVESLIRHSKMPKPKFSRQSVLKQRKLAKINSKIEELKKLKLNLKAQND